MVLLPTRNTKLTKHCLQAPSGGRRKPQAVRKPLSGHRGTRRAGTGTRALGGWVAGCRVGGGCRMSDVSDPRPKSGSGRRPGG
eukprot:scaffold20649_cov113-Isochrysis_galbana.AAC.1